MFLHDRIQQKLDERHLKQADLARATGKSTAAVTKWMKGDTKPKAEVLKVIAEFLGTSDDWLLTGIENIPKAMGFSNVDSWSDESPLDHDEVEIKYFEGFRVACGSGSVAEVLNNEYRTVRVSKLELRQKGILQDNCVKVESSGDSMSPTIKDGDSVYIDLGRRSIKDGKIFAICHGGLFKFKRLYSLPFGGIRVVSDNKDEFPEYQLTAEDIKNQEFFVLGWAWKWETSETW
ncbi:helix-turn-helix domain-containing protein [Acinetobacter wanghuae]|uniref:Helix-turn-helix domain-containing protein n=1 Tax=Acinetobacter wanghuae TaxID=2662362 RepID=A0ABX6D079_9GAMM|nr:S24 family peptidase [Acinetobacter wanghuae]QGA11024.1 helix-turn-helix domain-containing protein [Acinetobacter wanghuae]